MQAEPYKNVAAYKFVALDRLAARRDELRARGKALGLKGTILLSPEGINLFLSGKAANVDDFLTRLQCEPTVGALTVKASPSRSHSFNRFLVKLKKEIIAFGQPGIAPGDYTSPRVTPRELKAWLDEGRDVALLDTRNDYEVEIGTFKDATPIGLDAFRDFPSAAKELPASWKEKPVVTFCTGGIRCEKAAPLLEEMGFKHVYQLDGGILQYFEDVGGDHYKGDCFVFDKRVAVSPDLSPSDKLLCFACQEILTADDVASPVFVEGKSCPHCFQPAELAEEQLRAREVAFRTLATPLPGSTPYQNDRPIHVPGRYTGCTALEFLSSISSGPHVDWPALLMTGRILRRGEPLDTEDTVHGGERLIHRIPAQVEPDVSIDVRWIYEDEHLVAIEKPAPLPIHPGGRFNRNTLLPLMERLYAPGKLRPGHRLDASTTGVMVLAKTAKVARKLQSQFADGAVEKRYVARIHGRVPSERFQCDARISKGPVDGIRRIDPDGQDARTEFEAVGEDVVVARPLTGRTNQIRLHLWQLGIPLVGDPIYLCGHQLQSDAKQVREQPMCLHAQSLSLHHPVTGKPLGFTAAPPPWGQR